MPKFYAASHSEDHVDLLVLLPYPTVADVEAGSLFNSPENAFLLEFLQGGTFSWAVGVVFEAKLEKDPVKKDYEAARPAVLKLIQGAQPTVILSMGGHALNILWPPNKGRVPSVAKIRTLPVDLGSGRSMVCTYAPSRHSLFLKTDGRMGLDCTEEFIRAFSLCNEVIDGTYKAPQMNRRTIRSLEAVLEVEQKMLVNGVTELSVDIEDCTFISRGAKLKPHEWAKKFPDYEMPDCLTMWHDGNQCLEVGFTFDIVTPRGRVYETYTLLPEVQTLEVFQRLFGRKTLYAWNCSYEENGMFRFHGIDLREDLGCTLEDPMAFLGSADQSVPGLGLKENASAKLNIPSFTVEIDRELDLAKKRRGKEGGPEVASFGDCDGAVRREYNGWDTLALHMLVREYFETPQFESAPDDCLTYGYIIDRFIPYFNAMERQGICVDVEHVNKMLDYYEGIADSILGWIVQQPEVIEAVEGCKRYYQESGKKPSKPPCYNPRSPIFVPEFIKVTHGGIPEWYPKTDKGLLSRSNDSFGLLAKDQVKKDGIHPVVPVEEKTRGELLWHYVLAHKAALEAQSQYWTILNYTRASDHRIHANWRLTRTDTEDGGDEGTGGAVSGRTSTNPNVQNNKDNEDLKNSFVAPPGFVLAELDFGRAELVTLAYNTGDPLFCQWAIEGKDQHVEKGATLWGISTGSAPEAFWDIRSREDVERDGLHPDQKPWREAGKTQNFADVYLQEPATVAAIWGLSVDECLTQAILSQEAHPAIYEAKIALYEQCQRGEMIRTSILGRCRSPHGWVPSDQPAEEFLSFDREHSRRKNQHNATIYRSLWNTKIGQADANDITMCKAADIWERLKSGTWLNPEWVLPHNFIHDSNWYYIREDYVDIAVPELIKEMEDLSKVPCRGVKGGFNLPLRVEAKVGYRKGQMTKYKGA